MRIRLPSRPAVGYTMFQWKMQWVIVIVLIMVASLFYRLYPYVLRLWLERVVREAEQRREEKDAELKRMFWSEAERCGWEVVEGRS